MAEHPDVPKDGRTSSVLIIDDSVAVRAGIRALIDTDASLRTVGDAPNALEGLELARALRPDLILLDNEMPGTRGIDLLPTLRSEVPGSRVVMFSMSPAIADQARALGASAAVRKDGSDARLLEALREVRRGEPSTTVQLAAFARLRRERPTVAAHDVGILFTAVASYAVAFLVIEPRLGASAAVVGVASVAASGALLGPALGIVAAIGVTAVTAALWTITGHPVDGTVLRYGGNGLGAIALLLIGAGSGAVRRRAIAERRMGLFVDEAIGAGTRGGNPFMRRVRAALGSDAAILFALSSATRQLRIVSTSGVAELDDERTFLGVPALARAVGESRIVESGDDLVAGARSAAFAPVTAEDGTSVGVLAVFYRRPISLTPAQQLRLRTVAGAAVTALGPAE